MANEAIQDQWSPLSFVHTLGGEDGKAPPHAPNYMVLSDQRRLKAYTILSSFMTNNRRTLLDNGRRTPLRTDDDGAIINDGGGSKEFREYGDAMLLVETLRDLILGEDQEFTWVTRVTRIL